MPLIKDSVLGRGIGGNQGFVGSTRSLRDLISYMLNEGRSAVMAFGDSTCRFGSLGFNSALTECLAEWVPEVGKYLPFNCNSGVNQNADGMIHARRRDNFASKLGLSQSLPAAWDGHYIQYATGWIGPEPALLDRTTLTVDPGVGGTTWTVASTAGFPSSGRLRCENEIVTFSGKTATTFTGVVRAQHSTSAATHDIGQTVSFCVLGNTGSSWNIEATSGINPMGNIMQILFYTPNGAAVSSSSFTFEYGTCDNFEQAATLTNRDSGTFVRITDGAATAGGDYYVETHGVNGTNLEGKNMNGGQQQWPGGGFVGITGPGLLRGMIFGDKDKDKGFLSTCPISQGGKMLSEMLSEQFGSTNARNGLARYFWDYAKIRETDTGGNGNSRLSIFNFWGHNETGGGTGISSFVDPTVPWTIMANPYVVADNTTSIEVSDSTGMNTTAMGGGHVLINNERIRYTTLTGNTISGLTRGFAGTTSATHNVGDEVYQGYRPSHPDGIAADLLFFYNIVKTAWTSNPTVGGSYTEDQIDFVYVRPNCMSDDPVEISDSLGISTRHQREYKLRRFFNNIAARLTPLIPGLIMVDPSIETSYAERTAMNWPTREVDDIHDTFAGYKVPLSRAFSRHMRGGGKRSPAL